MFSYLNGMHHIGTGAAPVVAGHSFEIRADLVRPDDEVNGVLIGHGSVNSGYCLMIDAGHLVYDLNHYGNHHLVRSSVRVPTGPSRVAMRFDRDEDGTGGRVRLFVDETVVGEGVLPETFEHFVAFQGLDVGGDRLSPVRRDAGPDDYAFTGELEKVTVEILDDDGSRSHEPCD